jgi:hypothetical protein
VRWNTVPNRSYLDGYNARLIFVEGHYQGITVMSYQSLYGQARKVNMRIIHINGEPVEVGYGWKFLTPWGTTESEHGSFEYNLPQRGEKWSKPTVHPCPAKPDGKDCGSGRLHVMNKLHASYAPANWWPWFARYEQVVGQSGEKVGVKTLQLRRVASTTFARFVRRYGAHANLTDATLSGALGIPSSLSKNTDVPTK